ncbi:hypothetical protein LP414_19360 [Polaromonas sp. P1(28)-13]|nr:hypothetical protein LP414_19360 [Polaromonas sp. P1(28)-13]
MRDAAEEFACRPQPERADAKWRLMPKKLFMAKAKAMVQAQRKFASLAQQRVRQIRPQVLRHKLLQGLT